MRSRRANPWPERHGQRVACGPRVAAGEGAVGDEDALVGAHADRLAQDGLGLGRAHGDGRDLPAKLRFQAERFLDRVLIEGIDDGGHALPDERVGPGIDLDLGRIRNLLDTHDDMQRTPPV